MLLLMMSSSSRRLIYVLSNKIRQLIPGNSSEKKTIYDFSKIKKSPFNIKAETDYNANLSDNSFEIGLKKTNCIVWTDIPGLDYEDQIIETDFKLDSLGGYAAAGIIFRIMEEDSYYMALISSKGYLRLDVVNCGSPKALIAWTEIPDFDVNKINLKIIAFDAYLIFIVNDKWIAEVSDETIISGGIGFALASYQDDEDNYDNEYVCKAMIKNFIIDTRFNVIDEIFKKWIDESNVNAEYRLRLAETFAVMGEYVKSLDQIKKAWKRRDEAIRGIATDFEEVRTKKELLLASRMASCIGYSDEAQKYIDSILDQWSDSQEGKIAYAEKLILLYKAEKFTEFIEYAVKNSSKLEINIDYYTMLANSLHQVKEYKKAAAIWVKAYKLKNENGVYAANAAYSYELGASKKEALKYFLIAGKIFLNQDNTPELAAIMPKISFLGKNNWEARALCGKWAFSIEDYAQCEKEFEEAEKIRRSAEPAPAPDPAVYYLWGLSFYIKGKLKTAARLLEKAVKIAPDYKLFSEKLEEIKSKCK